MVTRAYEAWKAGGEVWTPARPVTDLLIWAKINGVRVLGTIGNDAHLTADRPMDHTPFASTQWPIRLDKPVVCAIDLDNVERDGVTLGQAIERDFREGRLPWLKYMNHGGRHIDSRDIDGDGERFEVYDSSDEHVHLSIRTDWADRGIGTFDPWREDDDMPTVEDLLSGRVKLTKATADRLGMQEGEEYRLDLLVQRAVIGGVDATQVGELAAKRSLAAEKQGQENAEALTRIEAAVGRLHDAIHSLGEPKTEGQPAADVTIVRGDESAKPAAPEKPAGPKMAAPAKATPASVAKKAPGQRGKR